MKKLVLIVLLLNCLAVPPILAQAQTLTYGFKAGISLSKFDGPSEMDGATELEVNDNANGFLVGALFRYWFTDLVGVKWELLYSQKGTDYIFNGPAYQILPTDVGSNVILTGTKRMNLNISNSYFDIPILLYGKFGKFEIEGGVNVGLLVASTASGELGFMNGRTEAGSSVDDFIATLDYKFKRDDPGEVDFELGTTTINIDGTPKNIPRILQAYYQFPEDRGRYFNLLDFGLNVGAYYYWNQGLFLGGRFNYGLTDVTRDDYDVSSVALDENQDFIPRSDKDRNISLQFSIGFSF
ncbi:MAG: outer membrane beta-barrel protein [Bacteroidota bacterium]